MMVHAPLTEERNPYVMLCFSKYFSLKTFKNKIVCFYFAKNRFETFQKFHAPNISDKNINDLHPTFL